MFDLCRELSLTFEDVALAIGWLAREDKIFLRKKMCIRDRYVYAPLATKFNEDLKDIFIRQTRLQLLKPNQNADLQIDGEITGYNQYNQAVSADGYSSETKLTITVNVRFVNNTNHAEDFEQQFSAFRTYDSVSYTHLDVYKRQFLSIIAWIVLHCLLIRKRWREC